ncbi:hypothetical protein LbFV_ORF99 [Leptopilina boulardi filamentous virus]|uniref:Uncharacterized protein n=1 Tax=Leptopilina boulardi filamentous virus TaxID=552509 RepID=A0A1S5YD17_9VIRU|nr:hypothetical protein LbFV_ORF99 [Leptopilina boulardi filamentous virus]AQQ80019.1 hypothetical protein LbFV_ORF99 [Leptopilina boulardi filamentous virus]
MEFFKIYKNIDINDFDETVTSTTNVPMETESGVSTTISSTTGCTKENSHFVFENLMIKLKTIFITFFSLINTEELVIFNTIYKKSSDIPTISDIYKFTIDLYDIKEKNNEIMNNKQMLSTVNFNKYTSLNEVINSLHHNTYMDLSNFLGNYNIFLHKYNILPFYIKIFIFLQGNFIINDNVDKQKTLLNEMKFKIPNKTAFDHYIQTILKTSSKIKKFSLNNELICNNIKNIVNKQHHYIKNLKTTNSITRKEINNKFSKYNFDNELFHDFNKSIFDDNLKYCFLLELKNREFEKVNDTYVSLQIY